MIFSEQGVDEKLDACIQEHGIAVKDKLELSTLRLVFLAGCGYASACLHEEIRQRIERVKNGR